LDEIGKIHRHRRSAGERCKLVFLNDNQRGSTLCMQPEALMLKELRFQELTALLAQQ